MARTSYTTVTDAEVSTRGEHKASLWQSLADNIEAARIDLVQLDQSEVTTTSATYVTLATKSVTFPNYDDYTGLTRAVTLRFEGKVDNGANTATYRLQDNATGNVSGEDTTTNTSYEIIGPLTVSETTPSWQNTTRTINIQAKVTAGTAYMQAPDRCDGYADV